MFDKMFPTLRNALTSRRLTGELKCRELQMSVDMLDRFESLSNEWQDDNDGRWVPAVYDPDDELAAGKGINWETVRAKSRNLYYFNPYGKGIIHTYTRSIVGPGFKMVPKCPSDAAQRKVDELWADWKREFGWQSKTREFVRRIYRDGEVFLRWGIDGLPETVDDELILGPIDWSTTNLKFKMLEPQFIRAPRSGPMRDITHGIITDPQDTEQVFGYLYTPDLDKDTEIIPQSNMLHFKLTVDCHTKRGLTLLLAVIERIRRYDKWQSYRLLKAEFTALLILIRKSTGSPAEIRRRVAADATGTKKLHGVEQNATYNTKMYAPGSFIDTNKGTEYEFLHPNMHSEDAQADGRSILLSIAAGVGLAEFMLTADASNANYSSTLVSEAPAIAELRDQQEMLRPVLCDGIFRRWLDFETMISRRIAVGECDGCEITWPRLIARNVLETARADQILNIIGVKSKETIATENGLDYAEEAARIKKEVDSDIEMGVRPDERADADDDDDDKGDDE